MHSATRRSVTAVLLVTVVGLLSCRSLAGGIPEPSLVIYGTVRNSADNNVRVTAGMLTWRFVKKTSGRTVTVTTQLTNLFDQFSYVLMVPCETIILGSQVSANALDLTPMPALFDRSGLWLASQAVSFVDQNQVTSWIASTNRGRMERIDLTVYIPIVDQDGNGIPDDWETRFFGYVGVDPNVDPDGDSLTNIQEYQQGTDPTDPDSCFKFIRSFISPAGGFQVEWSSVEGRVYRLERSPSILGSFSVVSTNIVATPPMNSFLDTNALGGLQFFYRLRLDN